MGRPRIEGRPADVQPNFGEPGRPGRKRMLSPPGQLWCTKGKHHVPIGEMSITRATGGKLRYNSWCVLCRRDHGREYARAEAAARCNAQGVA